MEKQKIQERNSQRKAQMLIVMQRVVICNKNIVKEWLIKSEPQRDKQTTEKLLKMRLNKLGICYSLKTNLKFFKMLINFTIQKNEKVA